MDPVSFAIVSLMFCESGTGINISLYAAVLEHIPVIGNMFSHTGLCYHEVDRYLAHSL